MKNTLKNILLICFLGIIGILSQCKKEYVKPDFKSDNAKYKNSKIYVKFDNTSEGGLSYKWDFGDGGEPYYGYIPNDSLNNKPGYHIYKQGGQYNVILTVTGNYETKVVSKTVNIPKLIAGFDIDGIKDTKVTFKLHENFYKKGQLKVFWDYGDGNDSINPELKKDSIKHSYSFKKGGNYKVTLRLTRNKERDEYTQTVSIPTLDVDFKCEQERNKVTFNIIKGKDDLKKITWDFGDGKTDTKAETEHTYEKGGVYMVTLTAQKGSEVKKVSKIVNIYTLKACFNFTKNKNHFTFKANCSENTLSNAEYIWDFGDDTPPILSNIPQRPHTYNKTGTFDVSLKIKQGTDSAFVSKTVSIEPVIPDFTISLPANAIAPCTVDFNNSSKNLPEGATYNWEFGDGNISSDENPNNYYETGGIYSVKLTVNAYGNSYLVSKMINIPTLTASFRISGGNCNAPCSVTLTNATKNISPTYKSYWDYGINSNFYLNNNTSHEYKYTDAGVYDITLQIRKPNNEVVAETYRTVTIKGQSVNLYKDLLFYYSFSNTIDNIVGNNKSISEPDTVYYFDRHGKASSAFKFGKTSDSTHEYRYIDTKDNWPNSDNLSVSFWIKPKNIGYSDAGHILSNNKLYIGYENNKLKLVLNNNNSSPILFDINSTNSWTHFVVTFNKETGKIAAFENGVPIGTEDWSPQSFYGVETLYIGQTHGLSKNKAFKGLIDEIRIYNRVINKQEVKSLYEE